MIRQSKKINSFVINCLFSDSLQKRKKCYFVLMYNLQKMMLNRRPKRSFKKYIFNLFPTASNIYYQVLVNLFNL